eukprot:5545540-Prymnesium_polylepis.1
MSSRDVAEVSRGCRERVAPCRGRVAPCRRRVAAVSWGVVGCRSRVGGGATYVNTSTCVKARLGG